MPLIPPITFCFQPPTRNECVQVIVRCRPMSNKEKASNFQAVVDVFPNRGVIEIVNASEPSKENKKTFTYDAVYNEKGSQQMIYDEVVRPLVSSVLEGFNGCVFGEFSNSTQKIKSHNTQTKTAKRVNKAKLALNIVITSGLTLNSASTLF